MKSLFFSKHKLIIVLAFAATLALIYSCAINNQKGRKNKVGSANPLDTLYSGQPKDAQNPHTIVLPPDPAVEPPTEARKRKKKKEISVGNPNVEPKVEQENPGNSGSPRPNSGSVSNKNPRRNPDSKGGQSINHPPENQHADVSGSEKPIEPTPVSNLPAKDAKQTTHVAFQYDREMKAGVGYKVSAIVNLFKDLNELKKGLINKINENREEIGESPIKEDEIKTREIEARVWLKLELVPASGFEIKPLTEQSKKLLYDTIANKFINRDFNWEWLITPNPDQYGEKMIEMKVTPYNIKGEVLDEETRTFNIYVTVEKTLLESFWILCNGKPEWVIGSIIVPSGTWFLAWWRNRKKKKEEAKT